MDAGTQTTQPPGPPKLEDQAATAALYVTTPKKKKVAANPLDKDNKLSSAGAATSLKYANPRDLPSFPSAGLTNSQSSAGAAATLANANHKNFEHWKPESSAPAGKAAMQAKDFKAAPLWKPETSVAGSNAASSAVRTGVNVNIWKPEVTVASSKAASAAANQGGNVKIWRPEATVAGNKAAGSALRNKNLGPTIDYGYTPDGTSRALLAATGAMASGRKRAGSLPVVPNPAYPDSANSASNALSAATLAHRPSTKVAPTSPPPEKRIGMSQADATRIHNAAVTNLGREMYSSTPPVNLEVEEKKHQAGIKAAATVMAKQMYAAQQKALESEAGLRRSDSLSAASSVHNNRLSSLSSSGGEQPQTPRQYLNLQAAAQKLASERLAKLDDNNAAYRNYYGASSPLQSKLSVRGRLRRRASSDSGLQENDAARSAMIRSQMSQFNTKVAEVDEQKQAKDRASLLAAAQRNVTQRMSVMDTKVFDDTGKASPAMKSEWEAAAKARAEAESSTRMTNYGKVSIGGGKYIEQSELEAIALKKVQPTLDEITEKADAQRAIDEQRRQQAEEERRIATEKAAQESERNQKTKEEWKKFREEEKVDERTKKEEAKAQKAEEKRVKEEAKQAEKAKKAEEKRSKEQNKLRLKISPPIPIDLASLGPRPAAEAAPTSLTQPSTERAETETTVPTEPTTEGTTLSNRASEDNNDSSALEDSDLEDAPATAPTPPKTAPAIPQHIEPLPARPAPHTETTVTSGKAAAEKPTEPPSSPKKTDQGTVSGWLKSKFARRASNKNAKPEPGTISSSTPKKSVPTSATPGLSEESKDSTLSATKDSTSDHPQPSTTAIETHPPPLHSNPPASSRASSISSLSSDEPTAVRGRSKHRSDISAVNPTVTDAAATSAQQPYPHLDLYEDPLTPAASKSEVGLGKAAVAGDGGPESAVEGDSEDEGDDGFEEASEGLGGAAGAVGGGESEALGGGKAAETERIGLQSLDPPPKFKDPAELAKVGSQSPSRGGRFHEEL